MTIQITSPTPSKKDFALFNLGFRVFFLCAIFFSIVSMSVWFLLLLEKVDLNFPNNSLWHAHEMIFGFAQAMICGFLLTATRNWTG
ncbi:MAG: NnrS family protein, partial [Calditrichia bacterium]